MSFRRLISFSSLAKVVATENTGNLTMCIHMLATTKTKQKNTYSMIMATVYACHALNQLCLFLNMGFFSLRRVDPLETQ